MRFTTHFLMAFLIALTASAASGCFNPDPNKTFGSPSEDDGMTDEGLPPEGEEDSGSSMNPDPDSEDGGESGSGSGSGDDNSGTDDSGDDNSGTDDSGATCEPQTFDLEPVPPNVMLVLDKSGSMVNNSWDDDGDPETYDVLRWSSLHSVVSTVVESDDMINFGLTLFPSKLATGEPTVEDSCIVLDSPEVPAGGGHGEDILSVLPPPTADQEIHGATPIRRGLETALNHLRTLSGTERYIVLVTDGAANCQAGVEEGDSIALFDEYDAAVHDVVTDALSEDIPTFVVGIDVVNAVTGQGLDGSPEVNVFEKLSTLAMQGGVPRAGDVPFYDAQDRADLQDALDEIVASVEGVVPCAVELDEEPDDPSTTTVTVDGSVYSEVTDCGTEDGFVFTDTQRIELCGAACDAVRATVTPVEVDPC